MKNEYFFTGFAFGTIVLIVIGLVITFFIYSILPILVAIFCKSNIAEKRFRGLCYKLNVIVLILEIVVSVLSGNGLRFNIMRYLLWTELAVQIGKKILNRKNLLVLEPKVERRTHRAQEKQNMEGMNNILTDQKATDELRDIQTEQMGNIQQYQANPEKNIRVKSCTKCVAPIVKNSVFCSQCGERILYTTPKCFCRYCGEKINQYSKYCSNCGKKI